MTGNRAFRVAATGARVLTGAVVAGACVVGVAFGVTATWPTVVHPVSYTHLRAHET